VNARPVSIPDFVSGPTSGEPPVGSRAFDLLGLTLAVVLVLHASNLPWWLSTALTCVLAGRWWHRRRHGGRIPRWLKLPALVLLTLTVVAYYGSIFGRDPGTALAVGLLILKLLETERARDVRVGIGFACFALMAALLSDQSMVVTIGVAVGLVPALATLQALEPAQVRTTFRGSLRVSLALLAAALPLALLAFVLVPRLSTPLWGAPGAGEASTGLSDSMSPGNFIELLTDDHPAMRVSFERTPPAPGLRYFRAYVMTDYDGRSWHPAHRGEIRPPAQVEARASVAYRINLEPTQRRVLPMLDVPLQTPAHASMGPDREVFADRPVNRAISYPMRSATGYRLQGTLDERSRRLALRLPAGFNPRTLALGAQWRRQYGRDQAAIARAALSLFHDGGFRYTLAPAPLARDAMDDFLFNTREGFCEHYASAFTVLMRAAGIPARVVTGYQGGYWNALGDYLLVRNSDAHAWSEIWLEGRGWVRIDPTAAVQPERVTLGAQATADNRQGWYGEGWIRGLQNHWDIVNRWWDQGVIGFDALRQRGLLVPFGVAETDAAMLGKLLALAGVLFMGLGLAWALVRRPSGDPLHAAMRALERKLARAGVVRRRSEGAKHYLSRAARVLPHQREELARLMQCYLELRYANDKPPTEPLRIFQCIVKEFRVINVVK
jgi:transglutaminase-like putative cysteine protease